MEVNSVAYPQVAYQGIKGSFSYLAMQEFFVKQVKGKGKKSFRQIFESLLIKEVDYAIVPVENTLAGSIYEVYDLFWEFPFHVLGEISHKISHNLLSNGNEDDLTTVYSHPKALEQCTGYFEDHPRIEKVAYSDTAGAAQHVADSKDPTLGAIASREAAELYGLKILRTNIEDNPFNYTRFLVLSREVPKESSGNKCSLIFTLPHLPQSLLRALECIADDKLNISKIESRPIHGKPFEYVFYIDIEFSAGDLPLMRSKLDLFRGKANQLKVLGFYTKGYR